MLMTMKSAYSLLFVLGFIHLFCLLAVAERNPLSDTALNKQFRGMNSKVRAMIKSTQNSVRSLSAKSTKVQMLNDVTYGEFEASELNFEYWATADLDQTCKTDVSTLFSEMGALFTCMQMASNNGEFSFDDRPGRAARQLCTQCQTQVDDFNAVVDQGLPGCNSTIRREIMKDEDLKALKTMFGFVCTTCNDGKLLFPRLVELDKVNFDDNPKKALKKICDDNCFDQILEVLSEMSTKCEPANLFIDLMCERDAADETKFCAIEVQKMRIHYLDSDKMSDMNRTEFIDSMDGAVKEFCSDHCGHSYIKKYAELMRKQRKACPAGSASGSDSDSNAGSDSGNDSGSDSGNDSGSESTSSLSTDNNDEEKELQNLLKHLCAHNKETDQYCVTEILRNEQNQPRDNFPTCTHKVANTSFDEHECDADCAQEVQTFLEEVGCCMEVDVYLMRRGRVHNIVDFATERCKLDEVPEICPDKFSPLQSDATTASSVISLLFAVTIANLL